ncbi:hypothetical protein C8J57DRAFT_1536442 [Mycena rebaudengoi]|nr:hypothetical protein C8J57DRAFT_1536442 [Mycena rebaudengoi]
MQSETNLEARSGQLDAARNALASTGVNVNRRPILAGRPDTTVTTPCGTRSSRLVAIITYAQDLTKNGAETRARSNPKPRALFPIPLPPLISRRPDGYGARASG